MIIYKSIVTPTALGSLKGSQLHKGKAMNNGRGESGEARESHSVTLQWCSCDESKTTLKVILNDMCLI